MIRNLPRWTAVALLLPALGAAPGCVTKPAVTVHHAELRGASLWGLSTVIVLQVRNDNAYDVQVRNVNVNVTFGRGYALPAVNWSPNQWLPSNQTTLVAVPVTLPWTMIPVLVGETSGAYAIPYHVTGTADVTATRAFGIQRDNHAIDESGSIPRQLVVEAARGTVPLPP